MQQPSPAERPRNWSDLTFNEFEDIYPIIELNAKRHFNCANILAEAGEHQNAIAHLILGTEELIKTFGALLAAKKMGVKKQSWFGKLFYHHKTRHDLIKDFFSVYLLFRAPAKPTIKKEVFWVTIGKGLLKIATATGNFFWWRDADDLKQRAFYVDYLGEIIDPAAITVTDYKKALGYVKLFEKDISGLMREIESVSPQELEFLVKDLDFEKIDQLRKQAYDLEKKASQLKR
jgi:AbiV family abortive infection protein